MNRNLLETDTILDLTTVARVNARYNTQYDSAPDRQFNQLETAELIRHLSKSAMVRFLQRAVKYKERTEYKDIVRGKKEYYVLGCPIDTDEDITVVENSDTPRVWTNTGDVVDSDYIMVTPTNAISGIIYIDQNYSSDIHNALKITYTGGMALRTCLTGSDGATAASGVFTSAGSTFDTDGVVAGDKLVIIDTETDEDATNQKMYTVVTVDSETQLTVSPAFNTDSITGLYFEVYDMAKSFIGNYPDIARAIDIQCVYELQRQTSHGMQSMGIDGESVNYFDGVNWLKKVTDVLNSYAKDKW